MWNHSLPLHESCFTKFWHQFKNFRLMPRTKHVLFLFFWHISIGTSIDIHFIIKYSTGNELETRLIILWKQLIVISGYHPQVIVIAVIHTLQKRALDKNVCLLQVYAIIVVYWKFRMHARRLSMIFLFSVYYRYLHL